MTTMPTITNYPSTSVNPKKETDRIPNIVIAPLLLLSAGTGGSIGVNGAAELSRLMCNSFDRIRISIEYPTIRETDTRSLSEHIKSIRSAFDIGMSDLAAILGITRPTAYAWLKGGEPKPEAISRIQRLSGIADRARKMNIERLDKLFSRPLADGRSLFDVLKNDEDPTEILSSLQVIAAKEAETRRQPKGSGKNLKPLDRALDEFSVTIVLDSE
jgi:transcriptional regulator with XRE-family HTH domain